MHFGNSIQIFFCFFFCYFVFLKLLLRDIAFTFYSAWDENVYNICKITWYSVSFDFYSNGRCVKRAQFYAIKIPYTYADTARAFDLFLFWLFFFFDNCFSWFLFSLSLLVDHVVRFDYRIHSFSFLFAFYVANMRVTLSKFNLKFKCIKSVCSLMN